MLFAARNGEAPLAIDLLVIEGFSLMSLAATMEPLRAANRVTGRQLYDWRLLSADGCPVTSSSGVAFPVTAPLDPRLSRDALIVVAAFEAELHGAPTLARLRAIARKRVPIGAIESGSWILARGGLLDGYRATVHWEEVEDFGARFPTVSTIADRFVIDRDRFTAGGASPALDMMLHMIRLQHGLSAALNVASVFIYDQDHLPTDHQPIVSLGRLGSLEPRLAAAVRLMEGSLTEPVSVASIAANVGLSARSVQTLFNRHLGKSPQAYYLDLRLDAAQRLLSQSDMSVIAIAVATGFASASGLARALKRRYGLAPRQVRRLGLVTGALGHASAR